MIGARIPLLLLGAIALGGLGYGAGYGMARDRYDTQAALDAALSDIATLRGANAALEVTVRVERASATAARLGMEEAARFGEAQLQRAADLEDLVDDYYGAEGGDLPAPDLLLRAIGLQP